VQQIKPALICCT